MKNIFYFLALLFLIGSCTPESDMENFKPVVEQSAELKACLIEIDCSYAHQITEEGCLFDLWAVLEQFKQANCPNGTLKWKKGTQPWVNLNKGETFTATLKVDDCEGFTCTEYSVEFSCEESCEPEGCNYNIDVVEGDNVCEFAITFDCDTELEVDGEVPFSIPIGNGICAVILTLEDGESSDLTFTTEDGQECRETIMCGEGPCNCDALDLDIEVEPAGNNCCLVTVTNAISLEFNCPFTASFHNLRPVDGPPFQYDVVATGPDWTQFEVCHQKGHPFNLIATLQLVDNHTPVCNEVEVLFSMAGCF